MSDQFKWHSVEDKLPKEQDTVWLTNGSDVWLGCIVYDRDGWCWAEQCSTLLDLSDGVIIAECESADIHVTHWMPLPKVPKF